MYILHPINPASSLCTLDLLGDRLSHEVLEVIFERAKIFLHSDMAMDDDDDSNQKETRLGYNNAVVELLLQTAEAIVLNFPSSLSLGKIESIWIFVGSLSNCALTCDIKVDDHVETANDDVDVEPNGFRSAGSGGTKHFAHFRKIVDDVSKSLPLSNKGVVNKKSPGLSAHNSTAIAAMPSHMHSVAALVASLLRMAGAECCPNHQFIFSQSSGHLSIWHSKIESTETLITSTSAVGSKESKRRVDVAPPDSLTLEELGIWADSLAMNAITPAVCQRLLC